jgi:MoaA/NifB/PqqE/SkfB family radical SAM enzyme
MLDAKKKFYLFKKEKNFCAVPWNNIKVGMDGSVTTCTHGTETLGHVKNHTIDKILYHDKLNSIRDDLFNNLAISNCSMCKSYETNDYHYLRGLYNELFASSQVDYSNNSEFTLSAIDLHWSSICNLKCITCWAKQSSSIAVEQGEPILHTPTVDANKIIDYIVQNQNNLKEIYLSGGEPTLIKYNLTLLKKLEKRENLQIRINTNMTFDADNQIISELKKFPNVMFTISADAIQDRFEYIRRGAQWEKFLYNLTELKRLHFKWRMNSVFFVCSALKLIETFDFFRQNFDIQDFTINQLQMNHFDLQARNLPQKIKDVCVEKYLLELGKDKNLTGQLQNCINELQLSKLASYQAYLDNIDRLTNKNWKEIFPELYDG